MLSLPIVGRSSSFPSFRDDQITLRQCIDRTTEFDCMDLWPFSFYPIMHPSLLLTIEKRKNVDRLTNPLTESDLSRQVTNHQTTVLRASAHAESPRVSLPPPPPSLSVHARACVNVRVCVCVREGERAKFGLPALFLACAPLHSESLSPKPWSPITSLHHDDQRGTQHAAPCKPHGWCVHPDKKKLEECSRPTEDHRIHASLFCPWSSRTKRHAARNTGK
mmetsp:Transcript_7949/g.15480  ORF Transcript_7949/g.15480 Transcript_7949/m.15480 type:complete len:220 (+) Transcript_7949:333-992(+)